MAVKSLEELIGEQGALPAAALRRDAKSLAQLRAEQAAEVASGARDPFLGHMVPYHVDHPNRPAIAGLFVDEGTRDLFNDVVDPTQWARPKGLHFERDDDKLAAYYTIDLGIPPGPAGFETETITEVLLGAKMNAKTAGQRIGDYWKNGQIQVQRADLALEILMGSDTPETWAELDRLGQAVTGDVRAKFRPWWEKMLSSTAEILPYSIEGLKASPEGMVPGALAGGAAAVAAGQAGPQALLPEEMISVPAAMWAGLKVGGTISAARRIGELEAGGALLDMLDMGIDRNIARAAAVGVGALNGGLEMLQIDTLLKTLPGGRKLAAGAVRRTVNKLLKEHTLRNLALRKSVEFAGYLGAETLTELAQESVNVSAEELGKVLHEKLRGEDIDPATIDEIVARYKEIGAKSLQGFAVLGLPGTATGTAVDIGETIVMRGSPALRMMPRPRQTQVRVFDPAETPPAPGKPSAVAEGEALAVEGLAAARPAPGTTPGQVTAKEATDESVAAVSPVAERQAPSGASLESALEGLPLEALQEKARAIGLTVKGKKAQLAALISEAIRAKVAGKQTRAERRALAETEAAIAGHPIYAEAAEAEPGPGLNAAALDEALRSGEPELAMLAEKRDMLKDGRSIWEINQAVHATAADADLDLRDYEHLLIGGDMAAPAGEAHPGSLSFKEFFDRLGRELIERDSPWLKRWTLPEVLEKPREMWRRLQRQWQAIEAHQISSELNVGQVAEAGRALTAEQEAELAEIDAEKVADEIIQRHKETLIGKLVGSAFDDTVELKRFRDALVKAYKAGTRQGIAEARAAYKAGQAKVKARRQLRQYVLKLMGRIKRPVGRSAAFPQRLAIKLIQDQMDPKFRRADTIARRRASREYFAQHPESEVPAKALKIIESIAPNELSVLQLEVIAQQVHELKRKGRILAQAAFAARREELAAARKTVADAIAGGTVDVSALEPVVAAPKISMAQILKDVHRFWLTPERVLDWFDGRKLFHGPILDLFWRRPADAESAKVVRIKAQMDAHRAALAEVGMTVADLHATAMEILGKPITVEQAMTIYNFGRNAYSRLAVTFGNFHAMLTEARWRAVNDFVESDPRLQYLADYMIAYYDSHYGRLREAVIVAEDRDPGHQDNYTPMRRVEANYTPDERNLLSEMMQRAHFKRGYEEKGMTLARQDIPEEYQKPIRLDGWQLMLEQAERREHYIAFAGLTKQMRAIGHDEAVVAALIRRHGAEAVKWLQRYTDVVANPYIYRQYNMIERMCGALRRNTAIAFLAWKISTALKQVASLSLYLPEAGHHLLQAGFEAASDWTRVREFVVARDPSIEFATLERELEELKHAKPGEYAALVQRFGKAGLKGLMWFDAPTRTIGWYGVYLHELEAATKAGLDPAAAEARAVAEARMTTSRTQPGARVFQIPEAYRTHEILNLFQQFTNQLNKLWNITSYDLPSLMMNHQYRRAFMTFTALGLQAGLIWTISHRRVPEDEDDFASIATEGFVGLIPFVGSNIVAATRGFGGDGIAAAEGGAAFALNMQKALGELGTEGRIDLKTLEAAYRGVAPVVGVPYTGPKNLIEFGATGDPYYLLGGRPTGESKNPKRKAAVQRRRKP